MDSKYDNLYARDSKGKILEWSIKVSTNGNSVDIMKSYGELEGAKALKWQRNIQGKNIGKSNETNSYEQAQLQCESSIRRQKDKGYISYKDLKLQFNIVVSINLNHDLEIFLPKSRVDASGNVKPMKAQQYYRSKKNWTDPNGNIWDDRKYFYLKHYTERKEPKSVIIDFPCMLQPKINGVRATVQYINGKPVILSKEGKEYTIPQLTDFLTINSDIFDTFEDDIVLDGELYIHGESLQVISSAVKAVNLDTQRIKFILFDLAIEEFNNKDRWTIIKKHIKPKLDQHLNCCIELITTMGVANDATVQLLTDKYIREGYEGTIMRKLTGKYAFGKRPMDMVKLKRVLDAEFTIVGVTEQDKDPTMGLYQCITDEGEPFEVNPKGTEEFKRYVLDNKSDIIGKKLTCTFYEYTDAGKPFHVIDNLIRDYE